MGHSCRSRSQLIAPWPIPRLNELSALDEGGSSDRSSKELAWSWDGAELLEQAQRVHHDPLLGELAARQAIALHRLDGHRPAGAGDTQELALVGALNKIAGSHQVALGDQLLDLEMQVRESGQIAGDELPLRLRSNDVGQVGVMADELGLQEALVAHFQRYTAQTSIDVAFSSSGLSDRRFAVVVETAAFRIVQESLTNVARHSGAARAEVEVRVADSCVSVAVTDRGRGITGDISTAAGAGLSGMHERVELLGGRFHVSSRPGQGTRIEAQIPLPEPDGGRP